MDRKCENCEHYGISLNMYPCRKCIDHDLFEPAKNVGTGGAGVVENTAEMPVRGEMVNHPKHYNMGSIEPIDVIEDWKLNFNLGSTVKYIARCDYKEKPIEDLEKAAWYLSREIERRKKEHAGDQ